MKYNLNRIRSRYKEDAIEFILNNYDYSEYSKDRKFKDFFYENVLEIFQTYIYSDKDDIEDKEDAIERCIRDLYKNLYKYNGHNFVGWILKSLKFDISDIQKSKFNKTENVLKECVYDIENEHKFAIILSEKDEYDRDKSEYEVIMEYYYTFLNSLKDYKKFTKEQRREIISCNGRDGNTYKSIAKKYGFTEAQIKNERKHLVNELIEFYEANGFEVERK